jgi:ubiquinone biosynthesis accessory factor UbiJ
VIKQVVLEGLQRTLNRYVGESTAARDLLAELDGKSLAVDVAGVGIQCVLAARGDAVVVAESIAEPPTARLRATPLALLELMRSGGGVGGVRATHAEVTGDLHVAEAFATLLKLARPDLEEELSHWVGDVAARELGVAAAGAVAWLRRAGVAFEMNAAEFLQEERRVLPAALEAQAFYADVERLRDDVERAAARLTQLEQRRAAACAASD